MERKKRIGLLFFISLLIIAPLTFLLGCGGSFNRNGVIRIVTRELGSGARSAFMSAVFGDGYGMVLLSQNRIETNSTAAVFATVSNDPQTIGYDSLGHLQGREGVRFVSIEGVEPTVDNVMEGLYPMARPFFVAYRTQLNTQSQEFRRFLQSSTAKEIIAQRGYIADAAGAEPFVPQAGVGGTVRISGSTSVFPLMEHLAEAFEGLSGASVELAATGSGAGRNAVRDGHTDFGMVSANITEGHLNDMSGNGAREISVYQVARDAIVVIVHPTNPIENLTLLQLRRIFNRHATPRYTSWASLFDE